MQGARAIGDLERYDYTGGVDRILQDPQPLGDLALGQAADVMKPRGTYGGSSAGTSSVKKGF
ncbi:hypothetical protein FJ934_03960 [Mesorhizobium sp. B2-4-12]|uniref:hypothetical protein n=1 Tax=Mesorhizobium sp. B2-4-12 TaxID=2589937 RepID=UPI00112DA8BF|nr:hypothetical protein [Mesorhizobium sp. B2-4-12]TPK98419.1 hypothetical protein FJ934_03960 [Mesorhizobium sp. B2-4-12]